MKNVLVNVSGQRLEGKTLQNLRREVCYDQLIDASLPSDHALILNWLRQLDFLIGGRIGRVSCGLAEMGEEPSVQVTFILPEQSSTLVLIQLCRIGYPKGFGFLTPQVVGPNVLDFEAA